MPLNSNSLEYITIRGFKSIASIEKLKLGPINIVIGANGSGKSNFIGVFSFLHAIREGGRRGLRDYVGKAGGAEKVLHFGSKTTQQIRIDLSFESGAIQYQLSLSPTSDDGLFPSDELVISDGRGVPFLDADDILESRLPPRTQGREANISDPQGHPASEWIRERLGRWRVYHLHDTSFSSPMRKTAKVNDNEFLRPDAANLAAFLYFLQVKHAPEYSLIRRTVQLVAPFFDDFRLKPLNLNPDGNPDGILLEWWHKGSDQYFDASSLSDGTLRFIALATLFLQPIELRPSVILVDEPELGLHPYAIEMLASLIRQASVETQVVVSTQSSLLLDHFEPEEVLVADRVEDGTQLTHLNSAQLGKWLDDYSLGQLWEKNQLAGRPHKD